MTNSSYLIASKPVNIILQHLVGNLFVLEWCVKYQLKGMRFRREAIGA